MVWQVSYKKKKRITIGTRARKCDSNDGNLIKRERLYLRHKNQQFFGALYQGENRPQKVSDFSPTW